MIPPGSRASLADGFSLTGDDVWSSLLVLFSLGPAQAFAGQLDAMGVVNEAVQDRIGVGGIADDLVPAIHGELGRDNRRAAAVSLLEDFEQIVTGGGVERLQSPIVEDEQIGAAERAQDAGMAPVAARQGEVFEELGRAMIKHRSIVAAGLVAERRRQPAFADAGRANDILPKNTCSTLSLNICIIRFLEGGSRSFVALSMGAWSIS